jgi:hypothetical protein
MHRVVTHVPTILLNRKTQCYVFIVFVSDPIVELTTITRQIKNLCLNCLVVLVFCYLIFLSVHAPDDPYF